jgi:hypothetical protein
MNEDEIEAKWEWTWVDAWRQVMKGDPSKMASLLLEDVPLTKSMREHLAYLFRRGRVRPDPQESKANVTLLVAALHFRALEALRREENRSRDKDLPKRRPLRQRPRDSAGQSLRPWRVPVMFWLAVEDPIPEKTRRSLKGLSKDDLVDLVVRTYGVSEESLRNLLAGRSRLYREVRPYLLSSKPSV